MKTLSITPRVFIPAPRLSMSAVRSTGPGGQNVNKLSTKIRLSVAVDDVVGLTPAERARLQTLARHAIAADGRLSVACDETRHQALNADRARDKLRALIAAALVRPKSRVATKPSKGSRQRRLTQKRQLSLKKSDRRWRGD